MQESLKLVQVLMHLRDGGSVQPKPNSVPAVYEFAPQKNGLTVPESTLIRMRKAGLLQIGFRPVDRVRLGASPAYLITEQGLQLIALRLEVR